MTTITPGTGGTLKSTSAEKALFELFTILRNGELSPSSNPSNVNYVSGSLSYSANVWSGTFSIPVVATISSTGTLTLSANEYLTGLSFADGTGNTFKSSTAAQTFIEIITYLQAKEADPTSNTGGKNLITSNYDADAGTFNGTVSFPFTTSIESNGLVAVSMTEYLL